MILQQMNTTEQVIIKTFFLHKGSKIEMLRISSFSLVSATCFRNARSFQQCKECLFKAADCYKQNRSYPFLIHLFQTSIHLVWSCIFLFFLTL